jgi:hypothetical protein
LGEGGFADEIAAVPPGGFTADVRHDLALRCSFALIQEIVEASSDGLIRTPTTRHQHSRERLRYGSDLTDDGAIVKMPFAPPPERPP